MPRNSVVMPCLIPLACCGSTSSAPSEWVCVSMNPGETIRPAASITRAASARDRSPIASTTSPDMPTSPR